MAVCESTAPVPIKSRWLRGGVSADEVSRVILGKRLSLQDVAKQFRVTDLTVARWLVNGLKFCRGCSRVTPEAWNEFASSGPTGREPQEVIVRAGLASAVPAPPTVSRNVRLTIALPKGLMPLSGFASLPAAELARMCGIKPSTARRWRRTGKAPAHIVTLLEFFHYGPLGMISPAWERWSIRNGKLGNSDGHEYTPGEVWVIPILHQRIAALEATIRQLHEDLTRSREFRMVNAINGNGDRPLLAGSRADNAATHTTTGE